MTSPDPSPPDAASRRADLHARLAALRERARVPALAAVVARRGESPTCAAVGLVDPRRDGPATIDTAFAWFSLTKIVTAATALRLVERGALSLETPLGDVLTGTVAPFAARGRTPTLAELLSHGAGLADRQVEVARWFREPDEALPPDDVAALRWLEQQARAPGRAGRRLRYSNLGYALLGACLARVAGTPFRELVAREVLGPLGCVATGFEAEASPAPRAVGVLRRWSRMGLAVRWWGGGRFTDGRVGGDDLVRWRDLVQAPHGGLLGPVTDLGRLLDAFVQGDRALLSPASLVAMGQPWSRAGGWGLGRRRCGLGWFVDPSPAGLSGRGRLLFHGGLGPGFTTELAWLPDAGVGVGVLGSGGYDARGVARELLRHG